MASFNLTFSGKIQPGHDPEQVKQRFAALLAIEDARYLARCFSGQPLVLRSGLDRRTAADLYRRLTALGAVTELVRTGTDRVSAAASPGTAHASHDRQPARGRRGRGREAGQVPRTGAEVNAAGRAADGSRVTAPASGRAGKPRGHRVGTGQSLRQETSRLHEEAIDALSERPAGESRTQPNPYAMSPFRATRNLRERPERAGRLHVRYLALTTAAFLILLVAVVVRDTLQPTPTLTGPDTLAPLHGGGLLLVAGERLLLHDRAGVGARTLGLDALGLAEIGQVLPAPSGDGYFVLGMRAAAEGEAGGDRGLWYCRFEQPDCEPFGPQSPAPAVAAVHPYAGIQLQAVPAATALRKVDSAGEVVATAPQQFATEPTLLLRDGLLYTNSPGGPALSVMRYEDGALGVQLDEILLLAPEAMEQGRDRVGDFAELAGQWWVILINPGTGERGLYLFDTDWAYLRQLPLPRDFSPRRLLRWGEKLLVLDPAHPELQRFNSEGHIEAPLRSDLLAELLASEEHERWLQRLLWQGLITCLLLIFVACAGIACLQRLRQLVFRTGTLQGAAPVAGDNRKIHWLDAPEAQYRAVRRLTFVYLGCACLLLAAAVLVKVEPHQLTAFLLLLAGPALALWFYLRSRVGHIGVFDQKVLLVDHRRTYHLGEGERIRYRGWFVMIDDVLVYTGPHWFPAFALAQLREHISPLTRRGVKADWRSVLVRLVESRHPLAVGAAVILMTTLAAISITLA